MWKKLQQNYGRSSIQSRERVIGNPVLVGTTMDEETLDSYKNTQQVLLERSSPSPPAPAPLHLRPQHQTPRYISSRDRPVSEVPTRSSMYSQPSPDLGRLHSAHSNAPTMSTTYDEEVSPPSSPESHARNHQHDWNGSPDISPVEEAPEPRMFPQPPNTRFTSSIPLPLRNLKNTSIEHNSQVPRASAADQSWHRNTQSDDRRRDTQWGDFVGQRRSAALQSADANRVSSNLTRKPQRKPLNPNAKLSFAQRMTQAGVKGLGVDTGARPEWKGYSGRQTNVGQIPENKERISPATIRNVVPIQRLSGAGSGNSGSSTPTSVLHRPVPETFRVSPPLRPLPPPPGSIPSHGPARDGNFLDDENDIKPIVPLKTGRTTPPKKISPPPSATMAPSAIYEPKPDWSNQPNKAPAVQSPKSDLPTDHNVPNHSNSTSFDESQRREAYTFLTGGHNPNVVQADAAYPRELPEALKNLIPEDQPPSRFSFTTYGTSTHDDASLPSSPELVDGKDSAPPSPILNRKRPVSSSTAASKTPARKPAPSHLRIDTSPKGLMVKAAPKPTIVNDAAWRDSKALPKLPPETRSEDKILNLEAEIDYLKSQRWNLSRVVDDLERQPRFPKEKLRAKQEELDEVKRQVHELGLKLNRACRRRDRDECREPSGLWVRRVTG